MFEKDKEKTTAFAFFKNPKKKPNAGKRILNGTLYAIVNMIKWNMLTLLTFWTIALAFIGVDHVFFSEQREQQRIVWQEERAKEEKQYMVDLDKFNYDLIDVMKNKKSLPEIEKLLQEKFKIQTTLMTNNIFEFSKNNPFRGSEEFLLNLDNKQPILYVRNTNENMEQSLKKLETEGKISLKEIPYNEYRKTLEVRLK